ncbi:MAG: hypothetical protein JWM76_2385 [Pseudonocardiales bacterium]|nr:hypothetical protein [Pseudonocardiales bacterium]
MKSLALRAKRPSIDTIAFSVDRFGNVRRSALRARLVVLLRALGETPDDRASTRSLLQAIVTQCNTVDAPHTWLLLAVLTASLPDRPTVEAAVREVRLDGPLPALARALRAPVWGPWPEVEVVFDDVIVDLHHTADTTLATGIQRVSREVARSWIRDHNVRFVRWSADFSALVELDEASRQRALHGTPAVSDAASRPARHLVPWRTTYLLPELLTEARRAEVLQAMATHSETVTGMIGFDCVPITTADTVGEGMGGGFSMMLSAAARMTRIATISEASGTEYRGWQTMLAGAGLPGPEIKAVPLAVEVPTVSDDVVRAAAQRLTIAGLPMLLVVGSHEPRKNHLAVLHAAELLWRRGLKFSLLFLGGNSWNGGAFVTGIGELRRAGRLVESQSGVSDELLWGAYRVARAVVFPSVNEGFGLPVAEALASGTPVITSGFGAMAEVAIDGGALFVDPRDDHDLAEAMQRILTDDVLHARLAAEATAHQGRSWDEYARETWDYLVEGNPPPTPTASLITKAFA